MSTPMFQGVPKVPNELWTIVEVSQLRALQSFKGWVQVVSTGSRSFLHLLSTVNGYVCSLSYIFCWAAAAFAQGLPCESQSSNFLESQQKDWNTTNTKPKPKKRSQKNYMEENVSKSHTGWKKTDAGKEKRENHINNGGPILSSFFFLEGQSRAEKGFLLCFFLEKKEKQPKNKRK